jgi:hypothetical protein
MKNKHYDHARLYLRKLREHLKHDDPQFSSHAHSLGKTGIINGMKILDMARLHEKTLVMDLLPDYPQRQRKQLIKRASLFFSDAIIPFHM